MGGMVGEGDEGIITQPKEVGPKERKEVVPEEDVVGTRTGEGEGGMEGRKVGEGEGGRERRKVGEGEGGREGGRGGKLEIRRERM
ncbi:hypothetical protein Pmani_020614 [Petrolisthes manimaculis]|uniref:Uncharacterized protein n=1 Tax=Petrolisthes manimaculis TaxID=1843537 RepID=A0AAE1U2W4_9EUCA|nr:hypothetical protein Pmani_020614 [Petrolisthes manimaculis]